MIVENAIKLMIKKIEQYTNEAQTTNRESNRRAALKMVQETTNELKQFIKQY